ncbi:MAG: desulfoferrodoxin [Patescibacteria group bacterium]
MVKEKNEIYKCSTCGNIVEINHVGGGTLVCCGQDMNKQEPNTVEASTEKHLPIVEIIADKIIVKVGSIAHPMEETHFIEWVELIDEKNSCKKFLSPGMEPTVEFCKSEEIKKVRAYCNLHGLWETEI